MTAKLVTLSLFQIIVLTFTLQEIQAGPSYIPQNSNTSFNFKLSDYAHLNGAKILRKELKNITTSVKDLIKQLDHWVFAEIANITNGNISDEKLRSLEDSLKILEMNVTELSVALSKKTNLEEIRRKSKSIQIYLNNFQKELNKNFRHTYQLINEYLDEINVIDKFYNLTIQKRYIDWQIEDELETKLADDCLVAAANKNFMKAALLLDLIKNSSKIEYIVENLNTDVAFKLATKIRNVTKNFIFYKAIYTYHNSIKLINDIDETDESLDLIIKLIKSIKEGIIDPAKAPKLIKTEAIEFNKNLSEPLRYLVDIKLQELDFQGCEEVDLNFIAELIIADYRLASEVLYGAYYNYSGDCNLDYLFKSMHVENKLSQSNALKFALFLKYFLDSCSRNQYESCDELTYLIDHLPKSVIKIVFAKKVCISQPGNTKYLRLSDISYDSVRYSAYVHVESYFVPEEIWKLIHLENNKFIVQNVGIVDTYLDTDLYNDDKSGEHAVYGWHNKPPNNGMWEFEITKNLEFFYIKNLARNEYLYISDETNNFAFTKLITSYDSTDNFEWKITNCTDVELHVV